MVLYLLRAALYMDRKQGQPTLQSLVSALSPLSTTGIATDLLPDTTISQRRREQRRGLTRCQRHRQITRTNVGITETIRFSTTPPTSRYPSPTPSPSSSSCASSATVSSSSSDTSIRFPSSTTTTNRRKRQISTSSRRTIAGSSGRLLRQCLPIAQDRSSTVNSASSSSDAGSTTRGSRLTSSERSSHLTIKPFSRSRVSFQRYRSHISPPNSSTPPLIRRSSARLRHQRRTDINNDSEMQFISMGPGSLQFIDFSPTPLDLSTSREINLFFPSSSSSSSSSLLSSFVEQQQRIRQPTRLDAALVTDRANEECPICKEDEKTDRSVLLPCMHTYCFACITRWIMINPTCPLCKGVAERLVHAIRSDTQFSEMSVAELRMMSNRRDSVNGGVINLNTSNTMQFLLTRNWTNEPDFPRESDRYRILIAGLVINAFPLPQNNPMEPMLLRQLVYILNLCSIPVVLGESERMYRSTEPSFLAENEALRHRLVAFVRRELCALIPWLVYASCEESVTAPLFLCPPAQSTNPEGSALDRIAVHVVECACRVHLSDTAHFVAVLRHDATFNGGWAAPLNALLDHTLEHFCRELEQFARFSGTLEQYDNVVCLFRSRLVRPEYGPNPQMHLATYIGPGCGLQISGITSPVAPLQRALISRIYNSFFRSSVAPSLSASSAASHVSSPTADPLDLFDERHRHNLHHYNNSTMNDVDKNVAAIDFANNNYLLEPIVHSVIGSTQNFATNIQHSRSQMACALLSHVNKVALVRGRRSGHPLYQAIIRELLMNTRWGSSTSRDRSMQRLHGLLSLFPSTNIDSLMTSRLTNSLAVMELDGGVEAGGLFQRNWAPLHLPQTITRPYTVINDTTVNAADNTATSPRHHHNTPPLSPSFEVDFVEVSDEPVIVVEESVDEEETQGQSINSQGTLSSPINLDNEDPDGGAAPSPKRSRLFSETPIEVSDSSDVEVEVVGAGSTVMVGGSSSDCCIDSERDNCCCALKRLWERHKGMGHEPDELYNAFVEFSRKYLDIKTKATRHWDRRHQPLINRPSSPIVISDGEGGEDEETKEEGNLVDLSEKDHEVNSPQPVPSTSTQNLDNCVSDMKPTLIDPSSHDSSQLTIYRPQTAEDFYAFLGQLDPAYMRDASSSNQELPTMATNEEPKSEPPQPIPDNGDDYSASDKPHRPASVA